MSYNSLFGLGSHSPDADLQAWWKLDTSLDDSSGNNKVLSVAGGSPAPSVDSPTTWLAGSYEFDGATDSLLHNAALASGQVRGIVCWAKKRSEGGGGFGRVWSNTSANNVLRVGGTDWVATTPNAVSASGAANDQWDFIYVARNESNTGYIARNAETPNSVVNSSGGIDNDVFYIGNGNAGNRGFDGFIASVAFFNRYLLQAERDEIYAGPEPLNTALPTLTMGSTSWSGTVGTWDGQSNGTVTYAWELRQADDNAMVESGTGATPGGIGSYAHPAGYYLWVRASNDGGYDDAEDSVSVSWLTIPVATLSANAGYDNDTSGDLEYGYLNGEQLRRCASFGDNWLRMDFGENRAALPTGATIEVTLDGIGTYTLDDLTGSGYSYGGTATGIKAALQGLVGSTVDISVTGYAWETSGVTPSVLFHPLAQGF